MKREINALPLTSGFTQAGVYSRRQFCADLEVYRPPEPLCNPRLREAAIPLTASGGQRSRTMKHEKKRLKNIWIDTIKTKDNEYISGTSNNDNQPSWRDYSMDC